MTHQNLNEMGEIGERKKNRIQRCKDRIAALRRYKVPSLIGYIIVESVDLIGEIWYWGTTACFFRSALAKLQDSGQIRRIASIRF